MLTMNVGFSNEEDVADSAIDVVEDSVASSLSAART